MKLIENKSVVLFSTKIQVGAEALSSILSKIMKLSIKMRYEVENGTWYCTGDTYNHFAALFSLFSHYFRFYFPFYESDEKHVSRCQRARQKTLGEVFIFIFIMVGMFQFICSTYCVHLSFVLHSAWFRQFQLSVSFTHI